jgi:hypothetical protein
MRVAGLVLGILGAVGIIVAYGEAAPQSGVRDPIAVRIVDDGAAVDIAVDPCSTFKVTEVQIEATAVSSGLLADHQTAIWSYRPGSPTDRVFHTSASSSNVLLAFTTLGRFPSDEVFTALVFYDSASAPKGFTNRNKLGKNFRRTQSAAERRAYTSLAGRICRR